LLSVALAVPAVAVAIDARTNAAGAVTTTPSWTKDYAGWNRGSSPTVADITNDGVPEVVFGHQDGNVRVLDGATGNTVAGWPRQAGSAIDGSIAVADLFKSGKKQLIVPLGSTWRRNQHGGVKIFNANGSLRCTFRTRDHHDVWDNVGHPDGYRDPVFSSPAIGDITGDGLPEIVFGSFDLRVYAIGRSCQKIVDYMVDDTVWSSPAMRDVDGDGRMEIFIGGDQTPGGISDWSGGEFRALKWSPSSPGGAVELWKRRVRDTIWSSPALGDINGDGRVEVVVGAGFFYRRDDGRRIYAWHADDGSTVRGWPVTTGGYTMPSPALGDLTGDGVPEVVAGSSDGRLRAYRGSGALLWSRALTFNDRRTGGTVGSPIIADLDGDGGNDVGAGNDWGYFVVDGGSGSVMAKLNAWLSYEAAGAVGQFSGGWKLIVTGFDTPNRRSRIRAFDIPTPAAPPWPMFHQNAAHLGGPVGKKLLPPGICARSRNPASHPTTTSSRGYWVAGRDGSVYALAGAPFKGTPPRARVFGRIIGIGATKSGKGYYMLDLAGRIFTFGDARSRGSMVGKRLNAPIIAMAPTPSGRGYWLLGRDGGVFTFGDAKFFGSTGNRRLNAPIIAMTPTKSGRGYWLLASDGGVFTFGNARFHGSTGNHRLAAPVISMAAAPSGRGYWLVARDGGVFSFGVPFYGSLPGKGLCHAPQGVQIRPSLTGRGYFVLASNGTVWGFGDAKANGSAPPLLLHNHAVDMVVRSVPR
jgi:hypothetical protein